MSKSVTLRRFLKRCANCHKRSPRRAGLNADDELEAAVEQVLAVDAAEVNYTHSFTGTEESEEAKEDDSDVELLLDPVLVAARGGVAFSTKQLPKSDPQDPEHVLLQAVARTVQLKPAAEEPTVEASNQQSTEPALTTKRSVDPLCEFSEFNKLAYGYTLFVQSP